MVNFKKRIAGVILTLVGAYTAGNLFLKGVSAYEYQRLPKEQKQIVDVLRKRNISENEIRGNMVLFNSAKLELQDAQKFLDDLNWDASRASINKAETLLSKIKILDTRSLLAELENIKKGLGTNTGAG